MDEDMSATSSSSSGRLMVPASMELPTDMEFTLDMKFTSALMESLQEHLQILQEQDPEIALAVRIAATIGLRCNEISGLRWAHIDLDRGLVAISEGITTITGPWAAVLSIDEGLVARLRDTRELLENVAADLGEDVPSHAYVISSDPLHRTPINSNNMLNKRLRSHMDCHPELPLFTLKDLRAFTQAVLRHASGQTTMMGHYRAVRTF